YSLAWTSQVKDVLELILADVRFMDVNECQRKA
ncbi:MAG: hypothetical protein ACI814_003969, partial [Mariniblastus sp.]